MRGRAQRELQAWKLEANRKTLRSFVEGETGTKTNCSSLSQRLSVSAREGVLPDSLPTQIHFQD